MTVKQAHERLGDILRENPDSANMEIVVRVNRKRSGKGRQKPDMWIRFWAICGGTCSADLVNGGKCFIEALAAEKEVTEAY